MACGFFLSKYYKKPTTNKSQSGFPILIDQFQISATIENTF